MTVVSKTTGSEWSTSICGVRLTPSDEVWVSVRNEGSVKAVPMRRQNWGPWQGQRHQERIFGVSPSPSSVSSSCFRWLLCLCVFVSFRSSPTTPHPLILSPPVHLRTPSHALSLFLYSRPRHRLPFRVQNFHSASSAMSQIPYFVSTQYRSDPVGALRQCPSYRAFAAP